MYLTDEHKARHLERLRTTEPDPDIISYLDRLNAIEGVCTVMSCMGWHPEKGDTRTYAMGYIALHLSKQKAEVLEHAADDLPSLCGGYAAELMKHWEFSADVTEMPTCKECEPTDCRRRCLPVVYYVVQFSGRVAIPCLNALIDLLS